MENHQLIFEEVTDPAEIERSRAVFARLKLNSDWLQSHWPDLLPAARGKYVAVAGQEAFIADTPEEAWRWTEDERCWGVRKVRNLLCGPKHLCKSPVSGVSGGNSLYSKVLMILELTCSAATF